MPSVCAGPPNNYTTARKPACGLASVTNNRVVLELLEVGNVSGELEQKLSAAATLQAEAFQSRARWTTKTLLGILYGIALLVAVLQIINQFMQLYGPVLNEM